MGGSVVAGYEAGVDAVGFAVVVNDDGADFVEGVDCAGDFVAGEVVLVEVVWLEIGEGEFL